MQSAPGRRTAAVVAVCAVVLAGCVGESHGTPNDATPTTGSIDVVISSPPAADPASVGGFDDGLAQRAADATEQAAAAGADVTALMLDRRTGQRVSNGNTRGIAIASVVKLFIADEMLRSDAPLSPADRTLFDNMLRRSDDSAAEVFWNRYGRSAIVTKVAERYGLAATRPPGNGRWWNTISTAADLVRFYDMLLSGAGGLGPDKVEAIVSNLYASAPTGLDGTQPGGTYPQRFGIPDGLPGERVGVKQGWMCCIGADWMHLSTGIVGADRRYIIVVGADQPVGDDAARDTITRFVATMFPDGRI